MDILRLDPIPPLPSEIIKAHENGNLAIFVGAGLSVLMGCWQWSDLAKELVKLCYDKHFIKSEALTKLLLEEVNNGKVRRVITVCKKIIEKESDTGLDFFNDAMINALQINESLDKGQDNIYQHIARIRPVWVTTNADNKIHPFVSKGNRVYGSHDFSIENSLVHDRLYHLHGAYINGEFKNMVFSLEEYVTRYKEINFRNFLQNLFQNWTVLFLGYGLDEAELLQFLDSNNGVENNRFVLKGYYNYEHANLLYDKIYYESVGISVIPFPKDIEYETDDGKYEKYDLQIPIIKNWVDELRLKTSGIEETKKFIDNAFLTRAEDDIEKVIQIIKNDKAMKAYFQQRLLETKSPKSWFDILSTEKMIEFDNESLKASFFGHAFINSLLNNCLEECERENLDKLDILQKIDLIVGFQHLLLSQKPDKEEEITQND